jgi:vacuolar protein sorting-associated protein 41
LLLILAYRTRDDDDNPIAQTEGTPKRGVQHRKNGLSPELRLINAASGDEIEVDSLTVSRYESLSASDYHLSTLYVPHPKALPAAQRGVLEAMGDGIWDAGAATARIFSSGASIISLPSSGDNIRAPSQSSISASKVSTVTQKTADLHPSTTSVGLKIFIQSPYDCVLAVKRELSDHLQWTLERQHYQEAYELLDEHPEIMTYTPDRGEITPTGTPSKAQQSLADFFADDSASQTTVSANRRQVDNSAVEKEKRRIGDLWIQQLVTGNKWEEAGKVAGRVLGTSSRWEHWILKFAQAERFEEITPYVPTKELKPPIPKYVYELILGHYIVYDRPRLKELLDSWDLELFDVQSIEDAIKSRLQAGDVNADSIEDGERGRDWRIMEEVLAKLYIADGRLRDALSCFIRLQNAEETMSLIKEHPHLLEAIRDDVPGFIMLRISKEQAESAPLSELDEASSEAVHLLVDEAYQGVIRPEDVVTQLQYKDISFQPYIFFYLRDLWKGEGTHQPTGRGREQVITEGRSLVEEFGDLAVELFAEYDRPLLMEFLKHSASYAFEKASTICEQRQYIPELV